MKHLSVSALALAGLLAALPAAAQDDAVAAAKAYVEKVTKPNPPWEGPSTGPKAQAGKSVVYVSADQRNGGARGVGEGVEEAAKHIGWTVQTIDGRPSVFIPVAAEANTFLPHPVTTGPPVNGLIPILDGLKAGEALVTGGAFILKAELRKREAGHGH